MSEPDVLRNQGGLVVTCEDLSDGVIVVSAVGEVDMTTCPDLVHGIETALTKTPTMLVIDLSGVSFFGSPGITALIEVVHRAPSPPLPVVVTPTIRRLLRIVGIGELLTLHDHLNDALPPKDTPSTGDL
jgi:anti-anti-sigma factor